VRAGVLVPVRARVPVRVRARVRAPEPVPAQRGQGGNRPQRRFRCRRRHRRGPIRRARRQRAVLSAQANPFEGGVEHVPVAGWWDQRPT
jgi:hypothetical protein